MNMTIVHHGAAHRLVASMVATWLHAAGERRHRILDFNLSSGNTLNATAVGCSRITMVFRAKEGGAGASTTRMGSTHPLVLKRMGVLGKDLITLLRHLEGILFRIAAFNARASITVAACTWSTSRTLLGPCPLREGLARS
jgi:hypothetical protein